MPTAAPGSGCPDGLRLAEEVEPGVWVEPGTRSIALERWEVVELAGITVVDGAALPPGQDLDPPAPSGPAIPVRSPVEVC